MIQHSINDQNKSYIKLQLKIPNEKQASQKYHDKAGFAKKEEIPKEKFGPRWKSICKLLSKSSFV